jgi:hypothetical protein
VAKPARSTADAENAQRNVTGYRWSTMVDVTSNPSFEGTWVDQSGTTWRRRGKRGRTLEERRVRSLLRRADVPLVVWQSFDSTMVFDPPAKLDAAAALSIGPKRRDDIVASEWQNDDGSLLLMFEVFC